MNSTDFEPRSINPPICALLRTTRLWTSHSVTAPMHYPLPALALVMTLGVTAFGGAPSATLGTLWPQSVGSAARVTHLTGHTEWRAGSRIALHGRIVVDAGASLRIGSGTIVGADVGSSIVVARNARLDIQGSVNEPVVLTCVNGASTPGCWDGLVILGNAPINHGTLTSPSGGRGGAGGCRESTLDGGAYGGCTDDDSSGALQYARIQYATHGLRIYGVGRRTFLQNIQVHRSLGHGLDVVGGTAQFRNLALTTNAQYGLAYSGGWTGTAQYVVVQQDATGYAGGILGRNAVGAGGDQNALPRSAPILANLTIVTPPSAPGNPFAGTSPAALRFQRGAAGRLHNVLLIEPAIGIDVDDASTCNQIVAGLLSIQGAGITAPVQIADPDSDPPECSAQDEASLLAGATTVTGALASQQLVSAIDVLLPDLRAQQLSVMGNAVGVAPPATGILNPVTFLGAIAARPYGGIPWYSGWTLGEQLAPPALVTLTGVVNAPGRGGVSGVVVQIAPVGGSATSDAFGRFSVSGVPAGPVEVSFVSGVPADCETPPIVRAVAYGTLMAIADVMLSCAPPPPSLIAKSIVSGTSHTCGLSASGDAYCWGVNTNGQLGDGTTTQRTAPTLVSGGRAFTALAAGAAHTCGLTSTGAIWCWGSNGAGRLGDGTTGKRLTPALVNSVEKFTALAAGEEHTCALSSVAGAFCWGSGVEGQLGDGSGAQHLTPTLVSGGQSYVAIAAGQLHSCAITGAGIASCWGNNSFGQLGDGTTSRRLVPTAVVGGASFISVTAGTNGSCALTSVGVGYCWGGNTYGEIGDGTQSRRTTPTPVSGGRAFNMIAMRAQTTCAVTGVGSAYCWGRDIEGQVGDGTTTTFITTPTRVSASQSWVSIAPAETHTCALNTAGAALCWGSNTNGQLGDGFTTVRTSPNAVSGALAFTQIAAGSQHTCARTNAGAAACWGWNPSGQLGDGSTVNRSTPTPVSGALQFSVVAAGEFFSCGIATAGGSCWGTGSNGQLGTGTSGSSLTPTPITGAIALTAVSARGSHACGLTSGGAAYCWGLNTSGQLGDATTTQRDAPTAVSGGLEFSTIIAGSNHTCALTSVGAAYCWGNNSDGQIGDGTTANRSAPTLVVGATPFVALTLGQQHSCGRTAAGAIYCWGSNTFGQLGNGGTSSSPSPVLVTGTQNYVAMGTGSYHTCGITAGGATFCWGINGTGQLGDGTLTQRAAPTPVSGGQNFTALAGGIEHTCALTASGAAFCWGNDRVFQLGLNLPLIRSVTGGIAFRVP